MRTARLTTVGSLTAVLALGLSACGVSNEAGDADGGAGGGAEVDESFADCVPGSDSADAAAMEDDPDTEISIAAFNGWIDTEVVAYLTEYVLEEQGYTVEVRSFDAAPGFTGVAQGDIDMVASSQLPTTHASYLEEYGDDLESQGCWYDEAVNTVAVTEDSPAQSIADLAEMADEYDNRIVGIEPGAGLMKTMEETIIPTYGLESLELVSASTPAMLAEVDRAAQSGDNLAMTMWHPHWAYDAYPLRDLEDPEGAFGDPEKLFSFTRTGFTEEYPKASQLMKNFAMDSETFTGLANLMANEEEYGGENPDEAVAEWAAENQDFIDAWVAGELGE